MVDTGGFAHRLPYTFAAGMDWLLDCFRATDRGKVFAVAADGGGEPRSSHRILFIRASELTKIIILNSQSERNNRAGSTPLIIQQPEQNQ